MLPGFPIARDEPGCLKTLWLRVGQARRAGIYAPVGAVAAWTEV